MTTTHKFNVDVTNPGQFLACCGLLELASCLDPAALARFCGNEFIIESEVDNIVDQFIDAPAEPQPDITVEAVSDEQDSEEAENKSPPLLLKGGFNFRLDWWKEKSISLTGFKTWGGPQMVLNVFDSMRMKIKANKLNCADFICTPLGIKSLKPFYFDCRLSCLKRLEMGFATEDFIPTYAPGTEALALIGLQRFRPKAIILREKYAYDLWTDPLPAPIAAAVAHGLLPALSAHNYQFPLVVRTGGKYKAFGPAR